MVSSDNFFNYDENILDAINILDMEKIENVAEQWKVEAHKKMSVVTQTRLGVKYYTKY